METHRDRPDSATPAFRHRVVVVSGMSGAGKSTTLKVFEDLGYECVDNVPLGLLRGLVGLSVLPTTLAADLAAAPRPIAVGVDMRTRDFDIPHLLILLDQLRAEHTGLEASLLFLDADDDVLAARYTETRRRHPLGDDLPVADGIALERRLLQGLREAADVVVDTSRLKVPDFKRMVAEHWATHATPGMTIFVASFGFRNGVPRSADLLFDVRFLQNPHYIPALRPLTGQDTAVGDYVAADPGFNRFFSDLTQLLDGILPRYEQEGKRYLTIAIGCTGGQHRSVYTAERLAAWINGRRVDRSPIKAWHRDMAIAQATAQQAAAQQAAAQVATPRALESTHAFEGLGHVERQVDMRIEVEKTARKTE